MPSLCQEIIIMLSQECYYFKAEKEGVRLKILIGLARRRTHRRVPRDLSAIASHPGNYFRRSSRHMLSISSPTVFVRNQVD